MKDKEKQITEMANLIYDNRPIKDIWNEDAEDIAKTLYEQGYQKIGKDNKVLTTDDYDKLCHLAYFGYDDYYKKGSKETAEKILKWLKEHYDGAGWKLVETYFKEQFNVEIIDKNIDNESFDCGYHEYAKEKHDKRVADTPNRIEFAKKQFEANNIDYTLKNEASGHFHCWRKSDNKLFQFYAGTGKITGVANKRGIHALIEILTR